MNRFARQHFWIAKALGLAACMYFAASATSTLIGSQLAFNVDASAASPEPEEEEEDEAPSVEPMERPPSTRRSRSTAAQDILSRNVFCPNCVDEVKAQNSERSPGEAPAVAMATTMKEFPNLPLQVMATMENDDPRYSLATIYDRDRGITGLFGVGDILADDVRLVGVHGGMVQVQHLGQLGLLRVGHVPPPSKPAITVPAPTPVPAPAGRNVAQASLPGAEEAIQCANESTCVVERKFVNSVMSNPAALAKQASIRPGAQGFTFGRVRPGTLPHLLGLQTGDILTEVNGEALDSLDKAIGLVTKLRNASNLSVTLMRNGQPLRKEIQIS